MGIRSGSGQAFTAALADACYGQAVLRQQAWKGIVVPTGSSAEVVKKFSQSLQQALADTRTKARLAAMGVEPMPGSADQMGQFVRAERSKWGRVISANNIKLD